MFDLYCVSAAGVVSFIFWSNEATQPSNKLGGQLQQFNSSVVVELLYLDVQGDPADMGFPLVLRDFFLLSVLPIRQEVKGSLPNWIFVGKKADMG